MTLTTSTAGTGAHNQASPMQADSSLPGGEWGGLERRQRCEPPTLCHSLGDDICCAGACPLLPCPVNLLLAPWQPICLVFTGRSTAVPVACVMPVILPSPCQVTVPLNQSSDAPAEAAQVWAHAHAAVVACTAGPRPE
jgi:hypothetical protein